MTDEVPQWAVEARSRAQELRRNGWTYEAIASALSDASRCTTPWWVYAQLNPGKSPEQIGEWMNKHHPDRDAWAAAWTAEYDPDAPRRMEEANQRELEYIESHPWRPYEEH
jgi:hypothetical protein